MPPHHLAGGTRELATELRRLHRWSTGRAFRTRPSHRRPTARQAVSGLSSGSRQVHGQESLVPLLIPGSFRDAVLDEPVSFAAGICWAW
jgi:hypothetical protein